MNPVPAAVVLHDLHHDHAGERALRGISLTVDEGRLFGFVGADGAGKSTLFSILSTLRKPDRGTVSLLGRDALADPRGLRPRLGYMPQTFSLYADLSVRENLEFACDIVGSRGAQARTIQDGLVSFSRLESALERPAGKLSGGMKQKLALCCALVRSPRLLLLDEPTVGVDPVTRVDFWDMLAGLRDRGTTILVSTPYMDEADRCDEVALMHEGEILEQGSPSELAARLPGDLWTLEGDRPLSVRHDAVAPAPLLALYATGGELRALAPFGTSPEAVLSAAKSLGLDVLRIAPERARVEDVLLRALMSRQAA